MSKVWLVLFVMVLVALGAGALFLLSWDIPAPVQQTEKVLPDETFPQ